MDNISRKQLIFGLIFLLYPVLVYFGLSFLDPRWLVLMLIAAASCQHYVRRMSGITRAPLVIAVVTVTLVTFYTGSHYGLLLYPVLINLVLFVVFAASMLHPPSVIESLARLKEPDLPAAAVGYTRNVTFVWMVFFLVNGTISLVTVFLDRELWALYNGMIAYLIMGVIFGVEWLLRRRIMNRAHA